VEAANPSDKMIDGSTSTSTFTAEKGNTARWIYRFYLFSASLHMEEEANHAACSKHKDTGDICSPLTSYLAYAGTAISRPARLAG
jgi:hypothetical protein